MFYKQSKTVFIFVITFFTFLFVYALFTLKIFKNPIETKSLDFSLYSRKIELFRESISLNISYIEENFYSLYQKDEQLIQYTRIKYLTPPSKLPYNLKSNRTMDSFSAWVAAFFRFKRNGIFIEAGANEGEIGSHTLYLEKELGWTGLLVECNPTVVPYLLNHHRKAWVASTCLAPSDTPGKLNFSNPTKWSYSGTLNDPWDLPVATNWTFFEVETIPLYTILAAIGLKEIDYFSFDIEGSELDVLRTFPFSEVVFKLLVIEIYFYTSEEVSELDYLLESKGYQYVGSLEMDNFYVHDSAMDLINK